jgi:ribosomal protein S18 acetylase RimI-like enzyme
MVKLVPMTQAEFETYREPAIRAYAREHVQAGNWSAEEALQRAETSYHDLLPEGVATPGEYLFTIRDEVLDLNVGMLWFAQHKRGAREEAFVYEILIYEAYRRRGYGTLAFRELEKKAGELGLSTISLHAFGHNYAARAMYEQLGYEAVDLIMAKTLAMQTPGQP